MTSSAGGDRVWTRLASVQEFHGARQRVCTVRGLELLLVRVGNEMVVVHNHCSHLGKSLEGGRVMGGHITCPFHGACFDLKSGAALSGPAVSPLHVFPALIEGDDVLADLSREPTTLAARRDTKS